MKIPTWPLAQANGGGQDLFQAGAAAPPLAPPWLRHCVPRIFCMQISAAVMRKSFFHHISADIPLRQGRIYIGASSSIGPGPEEPGGPFEKKKIFGKLILFNLSGPQAQTEPMGIKAMRWDPLLMPNQKVPSLGGPMANHFRGPH